MLMYGAMTVIIRVAVLMYDEKQITIGAITSFFFYVLQIIWNFNMISFVYGNLSQMAAAAEKVVEIYRYLPSINSTGGETPENIDNQGVIELVNCKFRYPSKSEVMVLKGVSLKIDNTKNRVVALCGTSGCGKSSIISLIQRFYDPEEG